MSTNSLILDAQKACGQATKKAAVSQALVENIQRQKQLEVLALFGSVDYNADYDYKQQRRLP